jgi:diaminopimelate epimerase
MEYFCGSLEACGTGVLAAVVAVVAGQQSCYFYAK